MFHRYAPLAWAAVSFVVLVLACASPARAQEYLPDQAILVLTTTAPGAPSADDIVGYYYSLLAKRPSPPPLLLGHGRQHLIGGCGERGYITRIRR